MSALFARLFGRLHSYKLPILILANVVTTTCAACSNTYSQCKNFDCKTCKNKRRTFWFLNWKIILKASEHAQCTYCIVLYDLTAYTYTQADMYKHVQFVHPHCMYTHTHAHVHTRPLMGSVSLHFVVIHTSLLLPGGRSQTWKKLENNIKKILHFFLFRWHQTLRVEPALRLTWMRWITKISSHNFESMQRSQWEEREQSS